MNQLIKSAQMTSSVSERELADWGLENWIYLRPIKMQDLADEMLQHGAKFDFEAPDDTTLISLHAADGSRIAVTMDEPSAVETALQHELEIASIH